MMQNGGGNIRPPFPTEQTEDRIAKSGYGMCGVAGVNDDRG
jgi:hypothetical protein